MIRLAEVIETFLPELERDYGSRLLPGQRQALGAIQRCRTETSGTAVIQCHDCGAHAVIPLSCGHRFCPQCQHAAGELWLERQRAKLLPADYYMITFTLPASLRALVYDHQREAYDLLIRLAWETLAGFGQRDRALQGDLGATAGAAYPHPRARLPSPCPRRPTRRGDQHHHPPMAHQGRQVPLPPESPGQGLPRQMVPGDAGARLERHGHGAETVGGGLHPGRQWREGTGLPRPISLSRGALGEEHPAAATPAR